MRKRNFFTNKYSISVLILLACMGVDILLHRGMSRVMIPSSFSDKIKPYPLMPAHQPLIIPGKDWVKAVNTVDMLQELDTTTAGMEFDLYFDTAKNVFFVYHDTATISTITLNTLLLAYQRKNLNSSLWFDLKNISLQNGKQLMNHIKQLNDTFHIKGKTILETSVAGCLPLLFNEQYFTSYYVPFFNPYEMEEMAFTGLMDSMATDLKRFPACALSGYYFQYPALKKFFPNYPFLTWSTRSNASIISYTFNRSLEKDSLVKVILYNR